MKKNPSLKDQIKPAVQCLLTADSWLKPYEKIIHHRLQKIAETKQRLTRGKTSLADFALGHAYFGLHFEDHQWVFREWAPNAAAIFLIGEMTGWQEKDAFALKALEDGIWEIRLAADSFDHGDLYRLRIHWPGGMGDRIPAYARRENVDQRREGIRQLRAEKDFEIAHWYERSRRPAAAEFYYRLVLRDWPNTLPASEARQRLRAMGVELPEKESGQ